MGQMAYWVASSFSCILCFKKHCYLSASVLDATLSSDFGWSCDMLQYTNSGQYSGIFSALVAWVCLVWAFQN